MVPDVAAQELSTQYKGCNYDLAVLLEGEKPPATQEGLLVFWYLKHGSGGTKRHPPNLFFFHCHVMALRLANSDF